MKFLTLTECYRLVATAEEWAAYKMSAVTADEFIEGFGAIFKDGESAASNMSKKAKENMDLRRVFEERILRKLTSGQWTGYGHVIPRQPEDDQRQIPIDVWSRWPVIKWDSGKVKGQGLEFINVAVTSAQTRVDSSRSRAEKSVGRPSYRPFILEAYEALKAVNAIDFDKPKSALNGPICQELTRRYPDRAVEFNGLEDSTIRKAITKLFDADKERYGTG